MGRETQPLELRRPKLENYVQASITPVKIDQDSDLVQCTFKRKAYTEEWVNCGLYNQRSLSIEPLWSYVKELFRLEELYQYGLFKDETEVITALVSYDLIVLYNHCEGLKLRYGLSNPF